MKVLDYIGFQRLVSWIRSTFATKAELAGYKPAAEAEQDHDDLWEAVNAKAGLADFNTFKDTTVPEEYATRELLSGHVTDFTRFRDTTVPDTYATKAELSEHTEDFDTFRETTVPNTYATKTALATETSASLSRTAYGYLTIAGTCSVPSAQILNQTSAGSSSSAIYYDTATATLVYKIGTSYYSNWGNADSYGTFTTSGRKPLKGRIYKAGNSWYRSTGTALVAITSAPLDNELAAVATQVNANKSDIASIQKSFSAFADGTEGASFEDWLYQFQWQFESVAHSVWQVFQIIEHPQGEGFTSLSDAEMGLITSTSVGGYQRNAERMDGQMLDRFTHCSVQGLQFGTKILELRWMGYGINDLTALTFNGCNKLKSITTTLRTKDITSFNDMFQHCDVLAHIDGFTSTSAGTSFVRCFRYCAALAEVPDMDLSHSTDCTSMFASCSKLTTLPAELKLSACTNASWMFIACSSLECVPKLTFGAGLTAMTEIFRACSSLKYIGTTSATTNPSALYLRGITGSLDSNTFPASVVRLRFAWLGYGSKAVSGIVYDFGLMANWNVSDAAYSLGQMQSRTAAATLVLPDALYTSLQSYNSTNFITATATKGYTIVRNSSYTRS